MSAVRVHRGYGTPSRPVFAFTSISSSKRSSDSAFTESADFVATSHRAVIMEADMEALLELVRLIRELDVRDIGTKHCRLRNDTG